MENVSKALMIIGSLLISVLLLSFMVFVFRRFGDEAHNTAKTFSAQEIEDFNSKFINYETGGNHNLSDTISVTSVKENEILNKKYSEIFNMTTLTNIEAKALVAVSQTLNKASDVVTAINDAIDVNYNNNNEYRYGIELDNSIEIIVDLGNNDFNFSKINRRFNSLSIFNN